MKKAIVYYRVSTERQGRSGLGLDAQKSAVEQFVRAFQYKVINALTEIESQKKDNRPVLLQALEQCRKYNATLLIAKLDRLGGNVAFIAALLKSKVEFIATDNPNAGKLLVHIMAAFAEHERDMISERTKAALEAVKRRGVELGANGKYVLSKENKKNADEFALKMKPIIEQIKDSGMTTVGEIVKELNIREIPTYRNNNTRWHNNTVQNILKRMSDL